MNTTTLIPLTTTRGAPRFACLMISAAALVARSPVAGADVRETVQRALPATVAVEHRPVQPDRLRSSPAGASDAASTPEKENSAMKDAYRTRVLVAMQMDRFSGTVVSADGLIVTLISGNEKEKNVTFEDGRSLPARVLVDDHRSGLRLLKVDAHDLPFLALAEQEPQIGQEVICTYCTSSIDRAAARGMVAATGRSWPGPGGPFVQLDLAAARMSGGAPLLDTAGRLVGIIARGTREPGERGLNPTYPLKAIRRLMESRQGDTPVVVQRGFVGIQLTQAIETGHRVVAHPLPESPAATAGIHDGDEIVAIDGTKVTTAGEVTALVGQHTVGEKVTITIQREGKEQAVEVTLGRAPQQTETSSTLPGDVPPLGLGPRIDVGGGTGSSAAPVVPEAVRPEAVFILGVDGKLYPVSGGTTGKPIEDLRDLRRLYEHLPGAARYTAPLAPSSEQPREKGAPTQRADTEKRMHEINRSLESLRQQMERLTAELQRLEKDLAGEKK